MYVKHVEYDEDLKDIRICNTKKSTATVRGLLLVSKCKFNFFYSLLLTRRACKWCSYRDNMWLSYFDNQMALINYYNRNEVSDTLNRSIQRCHTKWNDVNFKNVTWSLTPWLRFVQFSNLKNLFSLHFFLNFFFQMSFFIRLYSVLQFSSSSS